MVELGAFWGYYSLWFRAAYQYCRNILIEPDPGHLDIGKANFELNGFRADFLQAAVGAHDGFMQFLCPSDGTMRTARSVSVDGLVRDLGLERIHLLHADIQGAELAMLDGAVETIQHGRLNWLFLSTHHHSISGDPLIHQRCLSWLQAHDAFIVDEHSVSESFSGDGLIVAVFGGPPRLTYVPISRNIPSRAFFRD